MDRVHRALLDLVDPRVLEHGRAADRRDQPGAAGGLVVGPIRFVLLRQDLEALHRDAADDL
jgi:hypothetical protein